MSDKPVRVELEGCRCPGAPHHHDWVDLHPDPTVPMGAAVMAAIQAAPDTIRLQAELARIYLGLGIADWSFVEGDPPVTVPRVDWSPTINRLLPWESGGMQVADAADELYSERILRPLMSRLSKSLPGGPTDGSTSPTPSSGSSAPLQSLPSLPTNRAGRRSEARGHSRGKRRSSACK